MGKIEDIFEESWLNTVEMYKKDWIQNLKDYGKDAIKMYPANFYSEADLESQLTCQLRRKYKNEDYYGKKIYVKNQLTFSPGAYEMTPELSDRIKKLQKLMVSQVEKGRFKPDVAIETDGGSNGGAFNLFAELKYAPDFMLNYQEPIPAYFTDFLDGLDIQCQTMELAVKQGVCTSAYVCAISDSYVSHVGRKKEFDNLMKRHPSITFLVEGMSVDEKKQYF